MDSDLNESPRIYEEGLHPAEIFLRGTLEQRSDIILNHPDVCGFLYIHDEIISKAYFPKKVVNYSNKGKGDFKVIAAASGTLDDYVPFYAPETFVLSDHHHLEISPKLDKNVKTASFTKYAKDNKKDLSIPARLKKDKDLKNLSIIAFPVVLPLLRGESIVEGNYNDQVVIDSFADSHEIGKTWLNLKKDSYIIEEGDLQNDEYPFPETGIYVLQRNELPITVIWKTNSSSQCLQVVKREIDAIRAKKVQTPPPNVSPAASGSVPHEVAMLDNNTVVTAASKESKTIEKNEWVIAFYAILFAKAQYDRHGKVSNLIPAELSNDALELFSSSSSISEQSRMLADAFSALSTDIAVRQTVAMFLFLTFIY